MTRSIAFVLLVVGLATTVVAAEPRKFAQPLKVAVELGKILKEFPDAQSKAARDEALCQLATAAEQAKSTDHLTLIELYSLLERYDDALREVEVFVKQDPRNFKVLGEYIQSLCDAKRPDAALAAFRLWLAQDVKLADVELYLKSIEGGVSGTGASPKVESLIILLGESGKSAEGTQALDALEAKLVQLIALYDKGPAPPTLRRSTIGNFRVSVGSWRKDLESASARAALASVPSEFQKKLDAITRVMHSEKRPEDALAAFHQWLALDVPLAGMELYLKPLHGSPSAVKSLMIVLGEAGKSVEATQALDALDAKFGQLLVLCDKGPAPPTLRRSTIINLRIAASDLRKNVEQAVSRAASPSIKPAVAAPLSDLRNKLNAIARQFPLFRFPVAARKGPEWEKFLAGRKKALSQLATDAEAAKSTDHVALMDLYTLLDRHDDAAREARAVILADARNFAAHWVLINALRDVKRPDDVLAAFQQWLALDVPLADVELYLKPLDGSPSAAKSLMIMLRDSEKRLEATQALDALDAKLGQLIALYDKGPVPPALQRSTIISPRIAVRDLRKIVEYAAPQVSMSELRAHLDEIFKKFDLGVGNQRKTGPAAEKVLADRATALAELAASPVAATSTDLPALLDLHTFLHRTDDALKVSHRWLARDVTVADFPAYVKSLSYGGEFRHLLDALAAQGKLAESWQVIIELEATLERFLALVEKGPVPPYLSKLTIDSARQDALLSVATLQANIVKAESKAYAAATDPITFTFGQPLRLSTEVRRIEGRFAEQIMRNQSVGPVYDKARAQRAEAFRQLAAAAETAHSTDHVSLAAIYAALDRFDDAERESWAAIEADQSDSRAYLGLIDLSCRLKRFDEAVGMLDSLLTLDVAPQRTGTYVTHAFASVRLLSQCLANAGHLDQAKQVLDAYQARLERFAKIPAESGGPPPRLADYQKELDGQREAIANTKKGTRPVRRPPPLPRTLEPSPVPRN